MVRRSRGRIFKKLYLFLVLGFMYLPIVMLIIFSFNATKSRSTWGGFSLVWYQRLFSDPEILHALYVTFLVAIVSTVVSTFLGTLAAIGIHAMKRGPRMLVQNITYLPMLTPDIVTGISLMILFIFTGLPLGLFTLILAHIAFNVPYVIFAVLPKLARMDNSRYEAALDLGAKPGRALRSIVLPEIMPGVITGALLSFTLSLDDFVISFFAGGDAQNLSVLIFSMARLGINPTINALSALMFVVVLALLITVNKRASLADVF